jgi:hypothetical protein
MKVIEIYVAERGGFEPLPINALFYLCNKILISAKVKN